MTKRHKQLQKSLKRLKKHVLANPKGNALLVASMENHEVYTDYTSNAIELTQLFYKLFKNNPDLLQPAIVALQEVLKQ